MAYGFTTTPDPQIATQLDQSFASVHEAMGQTLESARAGDRAVAELVRNAAAQNSDLNSKAASENQILITTAAANTLLNGTAGLNTLLLRAVRDQPGSRDFAGPTPVPEPAPAPAKA
jgi:hypothetical protein